MVQNQIPDMIVHRSGTATVTVLLQCNCRVFRVNISLDLVHIENISGTFANDEVLTFTKENSTTLQVRSQAKRIKKSRSVIKQLNHLVLI